LLSARLYANVVRFLIPLVVTKEQLHIGLDILENFLSKFLESIID